MTTYCDVIKDCTQCPRYAKDCDGRTECDRPSGEWIAEKDNGLNMLKCSVCECRVQEEKYRIAVGELATRCPYCGAQLDKGGYSYDEYADRKGGAE